MDNQHREIKGYRELNEHEIELINQVKDLGQEIKRVVDLLYGNPHTQQQWIEIGVIDLKKGLMAITRAIAKPDFF